MEQGKPSRTAWSAACHRAVHQVLDRGSVFTDPYATALVGPHLGAAVASARLRPYRAGMRMFVASRSRLAADFLGEFLAVPDAAASQPLDTPAAAGDQADAQVIVLGAGLDTTGWRVAHVPGVRVFSVDHPATQAWARQVALGAGLEDPACLTRVPVDFESQDLGEQLTGAGFDARRPAFVSWLGVVPYLSAQAIEATVGYLGSLAAGTTVVADYGEPAESRSATGRRMLAQRLAGAARVGEPWVSFFTPAAMADLLLSRGFGDVRDYGPADVAAHLRGPDHPPLPVGRHPAVVEGAGHVVRAQV